MPFYEIIEFPHFSISKNWQNAWNSLLNILGERPWWTRIWTIQEAVLPTTAIVQLGKHHIDLETLFSAALIFNHHNLTCCDENHEYLRDIDSRSSDGKALNSMFERIGEMWSAVLIPTEESTQRFQNLYYLSRERKATDPRDSVFGMLGIFPKLLDSEADYKKSTAEVYSEATCRLHSDRGDLRFLKHASIGKVRTDLDLPS